jgi:uncharacterized protein (TIGR03067 family)
VLVASVGPAAPVPKPSPAKSPDADALVGRWVIVTRDSGSGHTRQINDGGTFTVEIKDGEISAGTDDQKWFASRPFTLDTTQSPRQIDIQMKRDSDRLGIYQLDGDTLTWCVPFHADLPRPTEFKGADGRPCYVLKRVKSETTGK